MDHEKIHWAKAGSDLYFFGEPTYTNRVKLMGNLKKFITPLFFLSCTMRTPFFNANNLAAKAA